MSNLNFLKKHSVSFFGFAIAILLMVATVPVAQAVQYAGIGVGSSGSSACSSAGYGSCISVEMSVSGGSWFGISQSCGSTVSSIPSGVSLRAKCNDPAPVCADNGSTCNYSDSCDTTGTNNCGTEVARCNRTTATNSNWSAWTDSTTCSATCGGGSKTQTRTCVGTVSCGGTNNCTGDSTQTVKCNTQACPVNGACGSNATNFPPGASYYTGTFCSAGAASPSNPAFPTLGGSTAWSCNGSNGGSNANCTATRSAWPINGSCGTAAVTYENSATGYSDSLCSAGTANPSNPTFPGAGGSAGWSCNGSNGGSNASCTAYKKQATQSLSVSPTSVVTGGNVLFSWNAVTGTSYHLIRYRRSGVWDSSWTWHDWTTTQSFSTSGLSQSIAAEVQACSSYVCSNVSNTAEATIIPPFDYSLSNSGNVSVIKGNQIANTITVTKSAGNAESVSFSASGLPPQASFSFSPVSCSPASSGNVCYSTLTITTLPTAPAGSYTVTVTGNPLNKTTSFTLTVGEAFNYSLSTDGAKTVTIGTSVNSLITATKSSGATQAVSFSASGLPNQAVASFSPTSCSPNNACSSTLAISTGAQTPTGNHTITITGTPLNKTATFVLTVNAAPAPTVDIKASPAPTGNFGDGPLNLGPLSSPSTSAYLMWSSANASSCTASGGWSGSKTVSGTDTISGLGLNDYTFTISCSGLGGTVSDSVIVRVYPSVSTMIWKQGDHQMSGSVTIPYNSGLTLQWSAGSDPRTTCTASGGWSGSKSAIGTEAKSNLTSNQNYRLDCGNPVSSSFDELDVVVLPPFDYSLSNSGNVSVIKGNQITNTIAVTKSAGNPESVSLSASGLPPYGSPSFSPASCSPNNTCSSTLTITTLQTTPAGSYSIIVSGSPLGRTTSFNLTVITPTLSISSFTATPSSGTDPLNDVDMSVAITSNQTATTNFTFYCDRSDTGTNITSGYGYKQDNVSSGTLTLSPTDICDYSSAGTYTAKVIVERGLAPPVQAQATVTVAAAFNYSLSNEGNKTVNKSASVTNVITATKTAGAARSVSFSVDGDARIFGAMGGAVTRSLSPTSCMPNGTCATTLTITTNADTPEGTYEVVVTGSPLSRETTFNLTVSVPAVTVSCTNNGAATALPTMNQAALNEPITWTATASGGTGSYAYTWGGTAPLSGKTGQNATVSYNSEGIKTGSVTATSGGKTATVNCAQSVTVIKPAIGISPATKTINEGQTWQMQAVYCKYGAGNCADITNNANWGTTNATVAIVNNTSQKGLVTAVAPVSAYVNITYTDAYGNSLTTWLSPYTGRAMVNVRTEEVFVDITSNPNSPGSLLTGQDISLRARGGTETFSWSAPSGTPSSGTGKDFTTKYATAGTRNINVTTGSQTISTEVVTVSPTLAIQRLVSNPAKGGAPLTHTLDTGIISSNIYNQTLNYSFWWDCSYAGINVSVAKAQCGNLPDPAPGRCVYGADGAKCDGMPSDGQFGSLVTDSRTYVSGGNFTPKVIVEKYTKAVEARTVNPVSVVAVDITAHSSDGPVTADPGTSVILRWTSTNANSCSASGDWSGTKPTSSSAESSPPISDPLRDYTFTLTCSNTSTGAEDSDSVVARTFEFVRVDSVTATPNGSPRTWEPKLGVDLRADVSTNIAGVTSNFTYYCDSSDESAVVTPNWNGKHDGVSSSATYDEFRDLCNYTTVGTYHPKVVVERGNSAGAKRTAVVVSQIPPNQAPSVTPLSPESPSDYCASPFGWTLRWIFSDPQGDSQSAYQIVIADTSNGQVVKDTGEVASASNSFSVPVGTFDFNKTYSWTIKVWDDHPNRLSATVGGANFTTLKHPAPALSASLVPTRVSRDEILTIRDTTTVYGGSSKTAWEWDFSGVSNYTLLTPTNQQEVKVKFSTTGTKNVKLKVTDSDGLWCQRGTNDLPSDSLPNITVGRTVPTNFQEVAP